MILITLNDGRLFIERVNKTGSPASELLGSWSVEGTSGSEEIVIETRPGR